MAKQVKTNAADVKAKQKARDKANGHAPEPQEDDKDAKLVQDIADAVIKCLHGHGGRCTASAIVEDLTEHGERETRWTSTGVNAALHLLAKEQQIVVEDDDDTHIHLWTEDDAVVHEDGGIDILPPLRRDVVGDSADPFAGQPDGVREVDLADRDEDAFPSDPAPEPLKTYEYRPTRYLMHLFTSDEINGFRADREEKDRVIDDLEADLEMHQEAARKLKKRIDTLTDEGRALSKQVREGGEYRNVPVEERKELDQRPDSSTRGKLMVFAYRLDTQEVVEVRELKGAERQGILFEEAAAKTRSEGVETREAVTNLGDVLTASGAVAETQDQPAL